MLPELGVIYADFVEQGVVALQGVVADIGGNVGSHFQKLIGVVDLQLDVISK